MTQGFAAAAAAAGSVLAATKRTALCDRNSNSSQSADAKWYREQAEHIALGLSLIEEAKAGWWHEVTRRYRQGEALDLVDESGITLLHLAAKAGKRRILEEMLSFGATYARDKRGSTPLLSAAASGHASVATTLLDVGVADVNETDSTGATALLIASQGGHVQLTRALLGRSDINPNQADRYGVAPLHKAVSFGHAAVVESLLRSDACPPRTPPTRIGEIAAPPPQPLRVALGWARAHRRRGA